MSDGGRFCDRKSIIMKGEKLKKKKELKSF
jgi:hypothetical protein